MARGRIKIDIAWIDISGNIFIASDIDLEGVNIIIVGVRSVVKS